MYMQFYMKYISATNSNFIINKDFKYQFEFPQKTI